MPNALKPARRRPGVNPQAARPQTASTAPSTDVKRRRTRPSPAPAEPMIPLSDVYELVARQFDERLNAYGAGDLAGFGRGYDQGYADAMAALGIAA